jgi:hypothetical protein
MNPNKSLIFLLSLFAVVALGVLLMIQKPSQLFGKNLTLRSGVVTGIQKEVQERRLGDPDDPVTREQKTYTYVAKFQLDGQSFVAKFKDPYQINEGDYLKVSGIQAANFFDVIAYRNVTLKVDGSNSWLITVLAGSGFACFAGFLFLFVIQDPKWYEQLIFLGFIGIGLYLIARGFFIKEALDLLNQ